MQGDRTDVASKIVLSHNSSSAQLIGCSKSYRAGSKSSHRFSTPIFYVRGYYRSNLTGTGRVSKST